MATSGRVEAQDAGRGDEAALGKAARLYREGAFDKALALLDGCVAEHPGLVAAHYLRGIVLKDAGDAEAAVAALDRAIALDADLERAHYHRGTARYLADDKRGALADLRTAIEREPDFLFAVYNFGVAAVALRGWDDAKAAFTRCLELDPANRAEYVDLLVEIGYSAAQEECYSQVHRIKNRLGVVGDQYRRLQEHLAAAGPKVHAQLGRGAARLASDLKAVYDDLVRFLRAVQQEPPEVGLIDMADVLRRCLFALSPRLHGIHLERDVDPWLPEVIGERRALAEALMNVLTNAVEACRAREGQRAPRIAITMRAVDDIAEVPGDDSVEIEVRDSGPGIPPEAARMVFNLGYTTKRFGSGVGLTYTERVVRAHGGRVSLRSAPEGGAAVTLLLPASPVGSPNLRNLSMRSLLFEDLRPIAARLRR